MDFSVDRARLKQRRKSPPSDASPDQGISSAPLATIAQDRGTMRIVAACPHARAKGVQTGLPLADARAILPTLVTQDDTPVDDAMILQQLARWCVRYTPWTTPEENSGVFSMGGGIWLDISGCAHLIGGELALLEDLLSRISQAGYNVRAAVADTPGAAWALARHGSTENSSPASYGVDSCRHLPVAGLRLPPDVLNDLHRLGLHMIGDLFVVPRVSLTRRFGTVITRRLDQLSGEQPEPLSPLVPTPLRRVRQTFVEPISTRDDIDAALYHLLTKLCLILEESHEGVRKLNLLFCRVDGTVTDTTIGTSRPVRNVEHLADLFREKLNAIDPGFGVEVMILNAQETTVLNAQQTETTACKNARADLAPLMDRLSNRLGPKNVATLINRASHIPEHASSEQPVMSKIPCGARCQPEALMGEHRPRAERPIHLLPQPEPIDVMALLPDHPPALFRWRQNHHRVARADGPERLGPEWWLEIMRNDPRARETRDYYALEDENGGRFWVYREGSYRPDHTPRWYLHGLFA